MQVIEKTLQLITEASPTDYTNLANMKNLINMHLIETDEGQYKFSILVNNIVFTDKIIHKSMQETIEAAIKMTNYIKENSLMTIEKLNEWEA